MSFKGLLKKVFLTPEPMPRRKIKLGEVITKSACDDPDMVPLGEVSVHAKSPREGFNGLYREALGLGGTRVYEFQKGNNSRPGMLIFRGIAYRPRNTDEYAQTQE